MKSQVVMILLWICYNENVYLIITLKYFLSSTTKVVIVVLPIPRSIVDNTPEFSILFALTNYFLCEMKKTKLNYILLANTTQ